MEANGDLNSKYLSKILIYLNIMEVTLVVKD